MIRPSHRRAAPRAASIPLLPALVLCSAAAPAPQVRVGSATGAAPGAGRAADPVRQVIDFTGLERGLILGEVFADRGYTDAGELAPRDQPGGMITDPQKSVEQALGMIEGGYVTSLNGKRVPVAADTLCLHGDQPGAVTFAKTLRQVFRERKIEVAAP